MKLHEIVQVQEKQKAGFIPYITESDGPVFMFMTPSDPKYGGLNPGIAKGHVDPGENIKEAAIREAEEELGLKTSNLKQDTAKLAWKGELTGLTETYIMTIYMGEVKDKKDFNKPHFETKETSWLSEEEFMKIGAERQKDIVRTVARLLK
jgi:8-oxo-dGTP pyrophosphatase MutT (NUDIX family)